MPTQYGLYAACVLAGGGALIASTKAISILKTQIEEHQAQWEGEVSEKLRHITDRQVQERRDLETEKKQIVTELNHELLLVRALCSERRRDATERIAAVRAENVEGLKQMMKSLDNRLPSQVRSLTREDNAEALNQMAKKLREHENRRTQVMKDELGKVRDEMRLLKAEVGENAAVASDVAQDGARKR